MGFWIGFLTGGVVGFFVGAISLARFLKWYSGRMLEDLGALFDGEDVGDDS